MTADDGIGMPPIPPPHEEDMEDHGLVCPDCQRPAGYAYAVGVYYHTEDRSPICDPSTDLCERCGLFVHVVVGTAICSGCAPPVLDNEARV